MVAQFNDEIPMPRETNFVHASMSTNTKRSLQAWTYFVGNLGAQIEFIETLRKIIGRDFFERGRLPNDKVSMIAFDHHPATTNAERMRVWDEAAGLHDYERTDEDWP